MTVNLLGTLLGLTMPAPSDTGEEQAELGAIELSGARRYENLDTLGEGGHRLVLRVGGEPDVHHPDRDSGERRMGTKLLGHLLDRGERRP